LNTNVWGIVWFLVVVEVVILLSLLYAEYSFKGIHYYIYIVAPFCALTLLASYLELIQQENLFLEYKLANLSHPLHTPTDYLTSTQFDAATRFRSHRNFYLCLFCSVLLGVIHLVHPLIQKVKTLSVQLYQLQKAMDEKIK